MNIEKLGLKILEECFEVTPSGRLKWRDRPLAHFSTPHSWRIFNSKFAGLLVPEERYTKGKKAIIGVAISIKGKRVVTNSHQILWALYYKKIPKRKIIHVDGDVWNNKIENLVEEWKLGDHS